MNIERRHVTDLRRALLSYTYRTLTQLYAAQSRPYPLSRAKLKVVLGLWLEAGWLQSYQQGRSTYYRARPVLSQIDLDRLVYYTSSGRSKSSSIETDNWFHRALIKLKADKTVPLWMEDARLTARKNFQGSTRKLVLLVPGKVAGLPRNTVIVSVIGSGSCVVQVDKPGSVANLVLAGMPHALATALMNQIHRSLKE